MKKVLAVSLGIMVGVAFGSSAVMASPDLTAHQFKIIQEHQNIQSLGSQAGWQGDTTATPLRGGYGGATGPKDGTGNKNGARKGGGTGTCQQQSNLPSGSDAGLTAMRGGGGGGGGGNGTCDGTGPKSGSGPKDGSGNKYGK